MFNDMKHLRVSDFCRQLTRNAEFFVGKSLWVTELGGHGQTNVWLEQFYGLNWLTVLQTDITAGLIYL